MEMLIVKKFLSIILVVITLVSFASCGGKESFGNENKNSDVIEIDGVSGTVSLDESTIKELLSAYPQKVLGLKKKINEYSLKLSADTYKEMKACKIEAYLGKEKTPEATFLYVADTFFIYDAKKEKYLRLTVDGVVDDAKKKEETTKKVITDEEIQDKNDSVLHKRYKKYDLSVVGLPKDISEYELLVTGNPAKASDGKQVYVIKVLEKDGTDTGYRFAVGEKNDYYFNVKKDAFVKLK